MNNNNNNNNFNNIPICDFGNLHGNLTSDIADFDPLATTTTTTTRPNAIQHQDHQLQHKSSTRSIATSPSQGISPNNSYSSNWVKFGPENDSQTATILSNAQGINIPTARTSNQSFLNADFGLLSVSPSTSNGFSTSSGGLHVHTSDLERKRTRSHSPSYSPLHPTDVDPNTFRHASGSSVPSQDYFRRNATPSSLSPLSLPTSARESPNPFSLSTSPAGSLGVFSTDNEPNLVRVGSVSALAQQFSNVSTSGRASPNVAAATNSASSSTPPLTPAPNKPKPPAPPIARKPTLITIPTSRSAGPLTGEFISDIGSPNGRKNSLNPFIPQSSTYPSEQHRSLVAYSPLSDPTNGTTQIPPTRVQTLIRGIELGPMTSVTPPTPSTPEKDPFATSEDNEIESEDADDDTDAYGGYDSDEIDEAAIEATENCYEDPFADTYGDSQSDNLLGPVAFVRTSQERDAKTSFPLASPSSMYAWSHGRPSLPAKPPRPSRFKSNEDVAQTRPPVQPNSNKPVLPPRPISNPITSIDQDQIPDSSETAKPRLPPKPSRNNLQSASAPATNSSYNESSNPPPLPSRPAVISQHATEETNGAVPPKLARIRTAYPLEVSDVDMDAPLLTVEEKIPRTFSSNSNTPVSASNEGGNRGVLPDSTRSNRSPPYLMYQEIHHKGATRCFALSGVQICTAQQNTRVWSLTSGENVRTIPHGDHRVTAICFRPARTISDEGRYLWVGFADGQIWVVDTHTGEIPERKGTVHNHAVTHIVRSPKTGGMWTLDENGILQMWQPPHSCSSAFSAGEAASKPYVSLDSKPNTHRLSPRISVAIVAGYELWTAYSKIVEVYTPLDNSRTVLAAKIDMGTTAGNVSAFAALPLDPTLMFSGHDCGKIVTWDVSTRTKLLTVSASVYRITAMVGVGDRYLWTGFQTGKIYVYDIKHPNENGGASSNWIVVKDWKAHSSPVWGLVLDSSSVWLFGRLQIASCSSEGRIIVWDGLMAKDWMDHEMVSREAEYSTYRPTRILVCSWNCDSSKPTDLQFSSENVTFLGDWLTAAGCSRDNSKKTLLEGDEDTTSGGTGQTGSPDIIVVGFQEMVDLENKRLTAKTLLKSKKQKAANAVQKMEQQYRLWRDRLIQAVRDAHGAECPYVLIECRNLVGLFTCVFVKENMVNPDRISDVAVTMVKTGLGGLHGNKGAIAIRFIVDDTSFCFINCHLAAGQSQISARNNDSATILHKSSLPPVVTRGWAFLPGGNGSQILDHECVIFAGDLNYRIDIPRTKILSLIDQQDWRSLLEQDQLRNQLATNSFFVLKMRGFTETEPAFAPTYKYDPGVIPDRYDTSEKKRRPAWCDRILYRPLPSTDVRRGLYQTGFRRHECHVSDHKPVSASFSATVKQVDPILRSTVYSEVERAWAQKREEVVVEAMVEWVVQAGGWGSAAGGGTVTGDEDERAWKALEEQGWDIDAALRSLEST